MDKNDIEELRSKVTCGALLEQDGWQVDLKESTRKAVKYRRGEGEIIIVIHDGDGWFDPLSDAKGDVFRLAEHLGAASFSEALVLVGTAVGFVASTPEWKRSSRDAPLKSLDARWRARRVPRSGSATCRYLAEVRQIPGGIINTAIAGGILREGPRGSMWAAHQDADGVITGWEERGPDWRGFATGGAKVLFRLGDPRALRLCVTEAAIDAMSLAALEGLRADTLYLSTGGGWSPATDAAIRALAGKTGALLIAATDNNKQGDIYAGRLLALAGELECSGERLRPVADDWNADLKGRDERGGEEEGGRVPHARRARQG